VNSLDECIKELVGAIRSVNRSKNQMIEIEGDDDPCFWQRKEWIDWILDLANDAESVLKKNEQSCDSNDSQNETIKNLLEAGDGLRYELAQWSLTERDKDTQIAMTKWDYVRIGATKSLGGEI
jgi:hypothetical protein